MKINLDILKEMNVLYAEDDSTVRDATVETLSIFFKKIYQTDNGANALKMYEQIQPNMIILDIRMPLVNGLEVASYIRQKNQAIPIIITTSYTETQDILKAIKLNLAEYLIKPFSFEQLRLALLEALKKFEQHGLLSRQIDAETFYDFFIKTVIKNNVKIPLTKNEVIILEKLLLYKGSLVTYETLEEALGIELGDSKASIKNTILRLRKKIGKEVILNIQDLGYLIT